MNEPLLRSKSLRLQSGRLASTDPPPAFKKGKTMTAYLSLDDVARVRRMAAKHNMTVSAYMRHVVTSHLDEVA